MSSTFFLTVVGVISCSRLYACCRLRRRSVSLIARSIDPVILSAYIMTRPSALRAARPIVCTKEVSERKKPSLSASKIATSPHSGISSPSRSRLIPIRTSNAPSRRSRRISIRSIVSISECIYRTRIPCSCIYSVRSSDMRLVRVVTRVRIPKALTRRTSSSRSSTCVCTGRISITGSSNPVGRMICSVNTPPVCSISHFAGVAETKTDCGRMASHSSNFRGRLSMQDGSRNPCSASVILRLKSPLYMPPICGMDTWLSSANTIALSGINSKSVGGGSPGERPVR